MRSGRSRSRSPPRGSTLPALVPHPPRACSRQTGAIVYRGYDNGRNPFATESPADRAEEPPEPKPLPRLRSNVRIERLIARARRDKEEGARLAERFICHLPKGPAAEEALKQQRRAVLARRAALAAARKKNNRDRRPRRMSESLRVVATARAATGSAGPAGELDKMNDSDSDGDGDGGSGGAGSDGEARLIARRFEQHLAGLAGAVTGLHMPDDDTQLASAVRDVEQRAAQFREQTTMTGLRNSEEAFTYVTLAQYRALHREFEQLEVEGRFEAALTTNAPMLFVGLIVTPQHVKRALNAQLRVDFARLVRQLMPAVPSTFFDKLEEEYRRDEEERRAKADDFRGRYDLSTVRDIERCFAQMLARYSRKERVSQRTRDPGMSRDEFLRYAASIRTMTEGEATRTFDVVAVEALDPSDGKILTVDGFAQLVKMEII